MRIKYQRPVAPVGNPRDPVRLPMQSKQFVTNGFAPSPAKPKLWGFHKQQAPSLCVVSDAQGRTLRVEK